MYARTFGRVSQFHVFLPDIRVPGLSWPFLLLTLALLASCGGSGGGGSKPPSSRSDVTRGPQMALVTEQSVVVAWLSGTAVQGSVEFGLDPGLGSQANDPAPTTEHVISLDGLLPSSKYFYRLSV